MRYILILTGILIFSSCEYDHYYIEQNYYGFQGGHVRNAETNEPVEGLPVGLYTMKDGLTGVIENTIDNYNLVYKCKTKSEGLYSYLDNADKLTHSWRNYNITILREAVFDSTKIEWQYYNYNFFDGPSGYLSLNDTNNIFYVEPSGWVYFNIIDFKSPILIACEGSTLVINSKMEHDSWRLQNYWSEPFYYRLPACLMVLPSKTHRFDFYKLVNEKRVLLKSQDFFIKNSFDHNSTPENISIKCDTIDVKVYE